MGGLFLWGASSIFYQEWLLGQVFLERFNWMIFIN